jgi:glycosyltransferase involved in cell wall biosynthesis
MTGRLSSPASILAVTSELPWPLDSGGHLRTYHLLRRLARDHRVTLLAPAPDSASAAVAALSADGIDTRVVTSSLGGPVRQAVSALRAMLRSEAYVMFRRHRHGAVAAALPRLCREVRADVLYLDHLDAFAYPDCPDTTIVGDLHNVYSTLLARTAADERRPIWRSYLAREARLLARAEVGAARRAHLLMTVSTEDQRHFTGIGARRVEVVPNGVDCAKYADLPAGRRGAPVLMFLGAMSWAPNAVAAEFLARDVLPALRATLPDVRLRIVGRDPSPRLRRLAELPGVEVTGSVPDVRPYLRDASVLAVPLNAGGGTRLKILEAFAAGLPVVSTPIGCEGIDATAGRHLVVAELETFAEALAGALRQADRLAEMATAARQLVEQRYDWDAIGRHASQAIVEAVAARRLS